MTVHFRRIRLAMLAVLAVSAAAAAAEGASGEYSLVFDPSKYVLKSTDLNGAAVAYRAYEGIVYVKRPVDTTYQSMNIYVPAGYYEGKTIGGYTIDTAPIFLPNTIGGYMPGAADKPGKNFQGEDNAALVALSKGLVVAAPGARGRTLKDASGVFYGKAPAVIVDLKAAVRYLRANDKLIPGDSERIISNGTSAGGAVSALLGASGDSADYEPYLKALGAAEARDDIFATSAYCPIANLENADAAYEWLLGGLKENKDTMGPPPGAICGGAIGGGAPGASASDGAAGAWGAPISASGPFTAAQLALSPQYSALFPAYVNSLKLKRADGGPLTLDAAGNGPFREYIKSLLVASAQAAYEGGANFSKLSWVTVKDGSVTDIDWNGYIQYCGRKKTVPAFDGLDLSSGENNLFGTAAVDNRHFTAFGLAHDTAKGGMAEAAIVKMMNPMAYIGAAGATTSKYWRIRHGTIDSDTANAIPTILATRLANSGYSVDFALPWDRPHSGDYDLDELFAWIAKICR